MKFFPRLAVCVCAAFPAAAPAQEPIDEEIRVNDEVTWNNRGTVNVTTGTILPSNVDDVTIRATSGGQFTIKKDQITSIKTRRRAEDIFKEKKQRLATLRSREDRAAHYLDLGLWCLRPYAILDGEPPLPDRAFDYLYKAVQIDPRAKQAYPHLLDRLAQMREAGEQQGRRETERELDIYMLARQGGFEDPEIDLRTAEILHQSLGRTAEAIRLFEKVKAGEGRPGANVSFGRRARRHLEEIYRERKDSASALNLWQGKETGDPRDPQVFEALQKKADFLIAGGKPEQRLEARKVLQKLLEAQPGHPDLARQLSALDFADGKFSTAEIRLARLVQGGSVDPDLLVDLTLTQIRQGKFKPALALLNRMLGDSPPSAAPISVGAEAPSPVQAPAGDPPTGAKEDDAPRPAGGEADGGSGSHGNADEAAPAVQVGEATPQQRARAHVARGFILDCRGDATGALSEYQKAVLLDETNSNAALLRAGAQLRTGNPAGSRATLDALVKGHADRRGLFGAYARLKADVEIAEGQPAKAVNLLEYAAAIHPEDILLRQKIGTVLLAVNEPDRAYAHLAAATKLLAPGREPSLMNALACYHYRRGNYDDARTLFSSVVSLVPRPKPVEGKPLPPIPPDHLYAALGVQLSDDARKLEMWQDDFNRDAGSDVARNWRELESFGISIEVREGRLLFQGQQTNDPTGVTAVVREEPVENVERVSVRLRFDGGSGAVRGGIRIESSDGRGGPALAGLVFFRDADGTMKYSKRTNRGGWEDGQPTTEKDPGRGKPVYAGDVRWPAGEEFHTLTIRRVPKPATGFEFLVDQKVVAQNVTVEGLLGKTLLVGISGQVDALNVPYRFEADDFRLYRLKAVDDRSKQR